MKDVGREIEARGRETGQWLRACGIEKKDKRKKREMPRRKEKATKAGKKHKEVTAPAPCFLLVSPL